MSSSSDAFARSTLLISFSVRTWARICFFTAWMSLSSVTSGLAVMRYVLAAFVGFAHSFYEVGWEAVFVGCVPVFDVAFMSHPVLPVVSDYEAFGFGDHELGVEVGS